MPNPSALNPWLARRHFGIVIDAGSSGSRLQIYSWIDPRTITLKKGSDLTYTLPKVEKGTQSGDDWVYKVEPGISSFADNPEEIGNYLRPLLNHAREHVPPSLENQTPLFLLATAGMRLLPPVKQAEVLQQACHFLRRHTAFRIDDASSAGPCGSSVRIITGEEEGLFGWIAVNYLMDGFTGPNRDHTTYGFLDMGGASTQIAFEPTNLSEKDAEYLIDVRLRLLGGQEIMHKVFVTTWLGYGTNQARTRYLGQIIPDGRGEAHDAVLDPCLPRELRLTESGYNTEPHTLVGTGSFERCLLATSPLLNRTAPCPDSPCLMNGIHVPKIDFSVSHFIGVSEYWYSSEHIFGLGGAYDFVQYERAASQFCSRSWHEIMDQHERLQAQHHLGGDGELEKAGKIVDVGKWDAAIQISRLQMQCFKAAWITNVLHEGIGLPRLTDAEGNATSTEGLKVEAAAQKKGLGRPTFQSLDTVGDIAISWTLGKMVLEASKEVPSPSQARPLVDPIEDIPNDFPIRPIRPPFLDMIEDQLAPHLPVALTRSSLGFSPVFILLFIALCVCMLLLFPLRRRLRTACLRSIRQIYRQDETYALEEGTFINGNAHQPKLTRRTWLHSLRRLLLFTRPKPHLTSARNSNSRHTPSSFKRISPTRSYSLPNLDTSASSTQYAPRSPISRPPSPALSTFDETLYSISGHNGGVNLQSNLSSRSRNGSQMNLANAGVRFPPSRIGGKGFD